MYISIAVGICNFAIFPSISVHCSMARDAQITKTLFAGMTITVLSSGHFHLGPRMASYGFIVPSLE